MFKLDRLYATLLPRAALIGFGLPDLTFVSDTLAQLREKMREIDDQPVQRYVVAPDHVVYPDTPPLEFVLLLHQGVNNVPVVDRESGRLVGMASARDLLTALQSGSPMTHGDAAHASAVIFGLSPLWVATTLFVGTYLVIMSDKLNRAIVALLGAGWLILAGVLTQPEAMAAVDFNTLGLLLGMMLIVNITRRSGLFQYVAIWSAKKVDARPWGILLMMSIVTAVLSAFLDNVTTVLLGARHAPHRRRARGRPYPSVRGGVRLEPRRRRDTDRRPAEHHDRHGQSGLGFNDFLIHGGPSGDDPPLRGLDDRRPVPRLLTGACAHARRAPVASRSWASSMRRGQPRAARAGAVAHRDRAGDHRLLAQRRSGIEPATIALLGAAVLLLLDNYGKDSETQSKNVHGALSEAEWITLMFFLGLFVLVHGIQKAGLIDLMAEALLKATGGDFKLTALAILWGSAILSAFIDNIPFVATMIPLIKAMGPAFGGDGALLPLWWALSLGACLGGNGTLIGASRQISSSLVSPSAPGTTFRFVEFLKVAFPLMLISIVLSHVYIYFRYLF